jgi:hypothetical protein
MREDPAALRSLLTELFRHPADETLPDDVFNDAALRVFRYQFAANPAYAAFAARRGRTPESVADWTDIPAVPTAAFKQVALVAGDAADAQAVFRTSGTTQGAERRGAHYIPDLSLYHASLLPFFAACVLPDGAAVRMLSLIPSAEEQPDSSLSHMVSVVVELLGARGSAFYATVSGGLEEDGLSRALAEAAADGVPVCLLGTSFAFVHWLDALQQRGERHFLPAGSRLMDTGGYKGRSREVGAEDMRRLYEEVLGIQPQFAVNEYGMTEMCSQFYDSSLRDHLEESAGPRRKLVPPWVRTRAVDPESLAPLEPGATGLLQHFDLANAGSVLAVQTEDLGMLVDGGFLLFGRAPGAAPRGCSIAMDLLLEAVRSHRG